MSGLTILLHKKMGIGGSPVGTAGGIKTATVGLTRNLTVSLDSNGKLIIIVTMYLGRVGPISLAVAFKRSKDNQNIVRNPIEEISVG